MFDFKKPIAAFLSCIMLITAFTGCEKNDNEPSVQTEETTAVAEPTPYPLFINKTEIKSKPEKVVCLSPAVAEIIFELGFGETIIGRSGYCNYPDDVLTAKDVGSAANPDINTIIDLMPEMVITSTPIASKDIFAMEQAGITTLLIPAPTTLKGFSSIYTALGLIYEGLFTGTEKGEEAYSEISKLLGNAEAVNIGKFIYVTENVAVAGGNTFESSVLSCFGTNIAKDGTGYTYDKALLLDNQPDVILLNSKYTKETLLNDEILSQLDAVKNQKIIYIDNIFFERPSSRIKELINNLLDDYRKISNNIDVSLE